MACYLLLSSFTMKAKMKTNQGYSFIELIIVIAIFSILASITSFAWQRYVDNTNLQNAARDIVSDFQNYKIKAVSESRDYQISFITGTSGNYIITAPSTSTHAAVNITKSTRVNGNGIQIANVSFTGSPGSNIVSLQARGTSSGGTVGLTNSRSSSATITTSVTGKAYVTFNLQ